MAMEFEVPLDRDVWGKLEGRCISCGFLCKRTDLSTSTIFEASVEDRKYFNFNSHPESPRQTRICCFVAGQDLFEEFTQLKKYYGNSRDSSQIHGEIVTKDIKCPKWFSYKSFMSPKEHFERLTMMQLERDRRAFEQKMENDKKQFELELFKINQTVQEDSKKIQEANKIIVEQSERFNKRITWLVVFLAILSVLFAFLQLAFPDGIPALIRFFGG